MALILYVLNFLYVKSRLGACFKKIFFGPSNKKIFLNRHDFGDSKYRTYRIYRK